MVVLQASEPAPRCLLGMVPWSGATLAASVRERMIPSKRRGAQAPADAAPRPTPVEAPAEGREASGPLEAELGPAAALELAQRAARRSLRRLRAAGSDEAQDLAADAIATLLRRALPLRPRSVLATVKHLSRRDAARLACWAPLDPGDALSEAQPWDRGVTASDPEDPEPAPAQPLSRSFADGSTARLDGALCEADIAALTLEGPDGAVLQGREALARAQQLLVEERRHAQAPGQAANARRSVGALNRDAALLSVCGLPWRDALALLSAQGISLTRDGLRSGQRAARLRCMGLTAHDAARSSRDHRHP